MDPHSPGTTAPWTEESSISPPCSVASGSISNNDRATPNSSPTNCFTLDDEPLMGGYSPAAQYRLSPQIMEAKRSFSLCALSLSNSSEADLSSGYFERRPYRPFRSNEEYLVAMREDLAEWLNTLYAGLQLNADNFLAQLETGVVLCRHANSVSSKIRSWRDSERRSPLKQIDLCELDLQRDVVFRANAQPGTFQARDNIANFITWCRRIKIHECLLFETEDLVMRKNEKSFVLCLLEVARYGAKFGVLAPTLVQFEQEIDRELAKDEEAACSRADCENESVDSGVATPEQQPEGLFCDEEPELLLPYGPQPQISNNDLESLHEKVVKLLSKCNCPVQFHLEHLSEGKYRIGDTKTLIFVRILRNHVMVRVGGGWDTLEHYLEKHDPCRCGRLAQRNFASPRTASVSGTLMRNSPNTHVRHERHETPSSESHYSRSQASAQCSQRHSTPRSVHSSPVPTRKTTSAATLSHCESLSSSPASEAASSLASSQNSILSGSSNGVSAAAKADRNNNSIKSQKRTSLGTCKRRVESRIPKLGKPPSGVNASAGLLPSKTRSTSSLALGPGGSQTPQTASRIPSLSSGSAGRSSTHNLSCSSLQLPQSSRVLPHGSTLSPRQKQRSTIELRTPTPPISQPATTPFSTSSLPRRNVSSTTRKSSIATSKSPVAASAHRRNASADMRQSLPSLPSRKDSSAARRTPSVAAVPAEFSRIQRQHSGASSLGDTSTSSTASSSLCSLTTAVPKSAFRTVPVRGKPGGGPKSAEPKGTVLVDVSSWLERNQLTS